MDRSFTSSAFQSAREGFGKAKVGSSTALSRVSPTMVVFSEHAAICLSTDSSSTRSLGACGRADEEDDEHEAVEVNMGEDDEAAGIFSSYGALDDAASPSERSPPRASFTPGEDEPMGLPSSTRVGGG
mmetsp:Transcript_41384/g.96637  ORF Transcript_41384/g.96637 Transcript_41384/m.96637 type:complete len:128 (-) Transcript_41384:28-411(-)